VTLYSTSKPARQHWSLSISDTVFQTSNGRKIQREKGISPVIRRCGGNGDENRFDESVGQRKRPCWNFFIYPSQFVGIYFRPCHTTRDARGVTQQQLSNRARSERIWSGRSRIGRGAMPEIPSAAKRRIGRGIVYGPPRWNRPNRAPDIGIAIIINCPCKSLDKLHDREITEINSPDAPSARRASNCT